MDKLKSLLNHFEDYKELLRKNHTYTIRVTHQPNHIVGKESYRESFREILISDELQNLLVETMQNYATQKVNELHNILDKFEAEL